MSEVVELTSELIRIDTSNYGDSSGPGERAAAERVSELLAEAGLEPRLIESEPGRASVIAHWGPQEQGSLMIHGHLDVVPAEAADWSVHPFSGEVRDGYVWGRGAVDMKDFDAMLLTVVRQRQREGRVPARGVTLVFTADEEAAGFKGAGHLVDHHRDELAHCTEAVGEVGGFSVPLRDRRLYLIEAAEKGMEWLNLTAHGRAGHGSMINRENAVTRLSAAVARIGAHEWPVQLTPAVETLLAVVGEVVGVEPTPENAESLVAELGPAARMIGATLRHVSNPTIVQGGYKSNVIPSSATASVDCRPLPGLESSFHETLDRLIGDEVEVHVPAPLPAWESPTKSPLMDAITASILAEDPEALVAPYLMSAGTDAKQFRTLDGLQTYGFAPLRLPADLDFTGLFHGVDERVPVDGLEFGVRVFDRFLDLI